MLTEPQIARWLITLQSYTGVADKTKFLEIEKDYTPTKGWLFDIGGLCIQMENLFKTLMINFVASHSEEQYKAKTQRPCWEYSCAENKDFLLHERPIDNLAQLYTNWARAIYIDPETDVSKPFSCNIVKLPELDHKNFFLEPMTLWSFNKKGDYKGTFTPQKHQPMRAVWRSLGLITLPSSDEKRQRKPEIMEWLTLNKPLVDNADLSIQAIGMQDDGDSKSQLPADQIFDTLRINNLVITDTDKDKDGWVIRINNVVNKTKKVAEEIYREFMYDISEIRGIGSIDSKNKKQREKAYAFADKEVEKLYSLIDMPFRLWLSNLNKNASKNEEVLKWYKQLYKIVFEQAKSFAEEAGARDYVGIVKNGGIPNIATAFNSFEYFLNKNLSYNGGDNAKQ